MNLGLKNRRFDRGGPEIEPTSEYQREGHPMKKLIPVLLITGAAMIAAGCGVAPAATSAADESTTTTTYPEPTTTSATIYPGDWTAESVAAASAAFVKLPFPLSVRECILWDATHEYTAASVDSLSFYQLDELARNCHAYAN
jgi:hypothetical protein